MIFPRFALLVILGLSTTLFSVVIAKPTLTNAQRLRRGLPLKKPVLRHPCRCFLLAAVPNVLTSSAARTRRDPAPSAIPPPSYGLIQVIKQGNNPTSGYLSLDGKVKDINSAAKFTFIGGSGDGLALTCENCGGQFLGISSPTKPTLSLHAAGDYLVAPSLLDGDDLSSGKQVHVWSFNSVTNDVSMHWANPDGTSSSNQGVSRGGAWLYISGDPARFNSYITYGSAYSVDLKFVPVS
ncbi:hypothetical protein DL96DRAFT_1822538 [Flagelloscypha sp. PMI_526]|nr:hypothetical protein DL96DRAFT_1822538 [Flagelloscypha sp. PMI_526]